MNIYHAHDGWPIFEADLELVFRVRISSKEECAHSLFFRVGISSHGFQVMLRICLVFPVKISSIQSPVFAVPAMEDYWTRASQAPCGWNAGNFVTKITKKERDDSMVKFREYIWSAYLAFLFVFKETETLTIFKDETNEN